MKLLIQSVQIDWDRLIAKHPTVLKTLNAMLMYLLKPEVLNKEQITNGEVGGYEINTTERIDEIHDSVWS